jgi:hypothetical protein
MSIFGMILVDEKYYDRLQKGVFNNHYAMTLKHRIDKLEKELGKAKERPDIFLRGRQLKQDVAVELLKMLQWCTR